MRNSNNKRNKAIAGQDKHDVIDVATSITQAKASSVKYVCKECEGSQLLRDYPQAQLYNPHAGRSYICTSCNKIYDSSLGKLPRAAKKVTGAVASTAESTPFIESVNENAGVLDQQSDYDRYDPEGDTDERMKLQGWHIIESKLELTDRQGNNRTIVKRTNQ
jgi:hypothetical protein